MRRIIPLRNIFKTFLIPRNSMALFTQVLNPITGQNEWETRNDDYDYHQEVANAGFGDMLHDWDRNQKYNAALRKTIAQMHAEGREAHVLDIGTGTGILAMMAVAAGADSVTACESFLPMANCAEHIFTKNGMLDKVRLIKKRSTELEVGVDMEKRANLLVTEVLDTELIGEGAIGIYNHAHEALLTDDVICIPARATCYAQLVQSHLAAQWNTLKLLTNLDGEVLIQPPQQILECKGEATLHDVQLSQLPLDQFRPLTEPIEIFEFDFNSKNARETHRQRNLTVKCNATGATDLVFYWWDIKMDVQGDIVLSCAPFWAHPDVKHNTRLKPDMVPWRDHWMQAIYYIPKPLQLKSAGAEFTLSCNHDEYSLWFDVFDSPAALKPIPRHTCSCSLHMTYARGRIGQLNHAQRNKRYMQYLERVIEKDSRVLTFGDGCILGLSTAKLGAAAVYSYEPQRFSRHFMEQLVKTNSIDNVTILDQLETLDDDVCAQITDVFAEPYFLNSILPWDNFQFGTLLTKIATKLPETVKISPHSARVFAVPVEFLNLHKIRTPLGTCEGFDLSLFDKMVTESADLSQAKIEAQPLWEYPCRSLAQPKEILAVVFREFQTDKETAGSIEIEFSGTCNGIAMWVDWNIDDSMQPKSIVSTGPTEPIEPGTFIRWDMFVRQGVHLISNAKKVRQDTSKVQWQSKLHPAIGKISFSFDVHT